MSWIARCPNNDSQGQDKWCVGRRSDLAELTRVFCKILECTRYIGRQSWFPILKTSVRRWAYPIYAAYQFVCRSQSITAANGYRYVNRENCSGASFFCDEGVHCALFLDRSGVEVLALLGLSRYRNYLYSMSGSRVILWHSRSYFVKNGNVNYL